jgi:hypothetical protein
MLLVALLAGIAGVLLSLIMLIDRQHCELVLPVLLPMITSAIFRQPLFYRPEQYQWIAGYLGGASALWTLAVLAILARQPTENRRIDAALMRKLGPEQAHGAPLEP